MYTTTGSGIEPVFYMEKKVYPSSTDAYSQLQNFNKTRRATSDILTEAQNKYGVGDVENRAKSLGSLVGNLQTSIDAVDPSVTGRTSGSLVTEAQRGALINRERTPLVKDFNTATGNLNTTQGDLTNARNQAGTYASALMGEQETKYKSLTDAYTAAVAAEAERQRKAEADRAYAESVRQFNEQQSTSKAAASAASGYSLGSGGDTPAAKDTYDNAGVNKQNAQNAIIGLFKTNQVGTVKNTIDAITKSAKNGNMYDKYKLELINMYRANSPYANLINQAMAYKAPSIRI